MLWSVKPAVVLFIYRLRSNLQSAPFQISVFAYIALSLFSAAVLHPQSSSISAPANLQRYVVWLLR